MSHDILWGVVDTACLSNLGFLVEVRFTPFYRDDAAKKAFVNRSEDVDGNVVEVIGRIDVVECLAHVAKHIFIHREGRCIY